MKIVIHRFEHVMRVVFHACRQVAQQRMCLLQGLLRCHTIHILHSSKARQGKRRTLKFAGQQKLKQLQASAMSDCDGKMTASLDDVQ